MNHGSDSILSVYSDARTEYTKQLCIFLVPAYFKFFIDLLEKARNNTISESKKTLWQFQTYLNEIHDWNMEKVNNEINQINSNCGCDYLDDLLTAVFIAHTKVLTAIRISGNNKKVQITVPKVEHFLFRVLCESSKLLWSSAFLFRDGISGIEKQQNYRNIEQLLNEGILQAIRGLVPVKSILKDFVNNDNQDNNDDSDSDDDEKEINASIPEQIEQKISNIMSSEQGEEQVLEKKQEEEQAQEQTQVEEKEKEQEQEQVEEKEKEQEQEQVKEIEKEQEQRQQMIYVEDRPSVQFADFNTVLDSDNPDNSDLVLDDKDDDSPDLEILDEIGVPLSEDIGFDNINDDLAENISSTDYESL
jgi:hypothetical protein